MMRQGMALFALPEAPRELVIRGVGRAAIAVGAIIAASSVHPQSTESSGAGFQLVSRCSNAARIVTGAAERFPEYKADRDNLVRNIYRDLKASGKLGKQLPSDPELFLTQVSMETLLEQGVQPRASSQAHDWVIAQTAATCVLKSLGN